MSAIGLPGSTPVPAEARAQPPVRGYGPAPGSGPASLGVEMTGAGTPGAALSLTGGLTAATGGLLDGIGPAQTGLGQRELRVDVTGLRSCDRPGLDALVGLRQRLHPAGVRVLLTGVPPHLRVLAERARLDHTAAAPRSAVPRDAAAGRAAT
ncbi:STAS domain-containing protein [Streptomyces sp. NPDC059104]|uniref:STAS domain-containing protein n=1 Tax=Streptomyces sp. NPDC059104 TaxID=3346729 RepID=UPI0036865284